MPAARLAKRPKLYGTPRTAAPQVIVGKVDAVLKELRNSARQFSTFESCLGDELCILERLYYKGVNQHRMAKFWKRVQEIRRLSKRILEAGLLSLTEDLRYAFYINEEEKRNPKIFRNAWLQVPDVKYILHLYERSKSLKGLLASSRDRFAKAYQSFSLMMQTGAFLQLMLVFCAIVSRMDALISEMDSSLDISLRAITVLLGALGEKIAVSSSKASVGEISLEKNVEVTEISKEDEDFGEDLGSAIIRRSSQLAEIETTTVSVVDVENPEQVSHIVPESPPSVIISTIFKSSTTENRSMLKRKPANKPAKSEVKAKKKKKKDEIDDIFSML